MRIDRTAAFLLASFGLTAALGGQAGVSEPRSRTSERQHVMGRITVESLAAGHTRIQLWLNTPTYLAKPVDLEADSFAMTQQAQGGLLIESTSPVRVTGFRLGQDINNIAVLQNAQGNVLTWEQGFKLRILANGTPEWGCCPRKE